MSEDASLDEPADDPAADVRFRCPGCDEEVDVPTGAVGQLVRCPYCSSDFFAAHGQTHQLIVDDTDPPVADDRPPDELDANRIRQLSALRIATQRTRSWWLTGAALAGLTAVNAVAKAIGYAVGSHAWGVWPTGLTLAAVALSVVAAYATRQAAHLAREIATSAVADPPTEPDFSTLDNGSDRWQRLDEVR